MRYLPVIWLVIVFAVPIGAAWTLVLQPQWHPDSGNHGELIQPPVPVGGGRGWTLAVPASGPCIEACEQTLHLLRRVERALGVESRRVQSMACPPASNEGPCAGLARALTEGTALVVVDPMGNAVLRYAHGFSPFDLLDDLERLLRVSKNWRTDGK
ncbi:MAG: hypothetical protein M0R77_20415 [Gammaproteobacteria bacterium]|nr:hypothetical protein [Gammaproteobacteria bacterium]